MSRTVPPAPLNDRRMWRRLLARIHPDAGGSDEMFVWAQALWEQIAAVGEASRCSACVHESPGAERRPRKSRDEGVIRERGRVSFPEFAAFEGLTRRALIVAEEVGGVFAVPLRLLHDCRPTERLEREQGRGASYKQLAAIGHAVGMSGSQRARWYEIAKSVPLSQRHAGHVLSKLEERA